MLRPGTRFTRISILSIGMGSRGPHLIERDLLKRYIAERQARAVAEDHARHGIGDHDAINHGAEVGLQTHGIRRWRYRFRLHLREQPEYSSVPTGSPCIARVTLVSDRCWAGSPTLMGWSLGATR